MIIQGTENLGTNQDGAPVVIDTDKQQNVVGTRVDSSLLTPTLQEIFYAIKGMGGAVPGTDNKQLLGILENLQSNLGNLNAAIQQEAQTRAANAAADKQALTNLIGQNTNSLSGLSDTIATLTATTDSYNTNITQQVSNAQTEIGKIIDTLRDSLGVLTNEVNAIETNFDFREVEVSDANPNTSNDFSQYGVLIANADSGMSNTIVITGTASGIQGSSQMNACRARVVLGNVTSSCKAQFIYGQHTYNIDLTGISTVPRNVQFSITLASNGQAYSSGFQADGVDNTGSIIAANGANIVVSNADSTDYQIKQVGVSKGTGNVWASTADGTVISLQSSGDYATDSALQQETARAQAAEGSIQSALQQEVARAEAAEAGLLPLSGGTLTGDIDLTGNTWQNNLYSRALRLTADNSGNRAAIQLLGTSENPVLQLLTGGSDGSTRNWSFNNNGPVVSSSGGVLPEVLGLSGRVVTQCFRIQNLGDIQYIPFPVAFNSADPVNQIFILLGNGYYANGGRESSVTYLYKQKTTNQGFWLDRSSSGFNAAFDVVAIGVM